MVLNNCAGDWGRRRSNPELQAVFGDVTGKRQEQWPNIRRMETNGELAPIPPLPEEE